jgi:hypothetical protein
MTNPTAFDLANDHNFRELLGAGLPPIPAKITGASDYHYTLESLIGEGELTAVALNGWTYTASDLVYVLLAAGSADNGVILGTIGGTADQHLHIGNPSPPDAPLSVRSDSGRMFLSESTHADGTEQTLIQAGEIGQMHTSQVLISNNAGNVNTVTVNHLVPASSYNLQNISAGGDIVQVRTYADGSLRAARTSGTDTCTLFVRTLALD